MTALLKVGEDNLNNTKSQLQSSQGSIFNTLRMIEIGKYEYDRYNAHKVIMQIIAFTAMQCDQMSIFANNPLLL